MADTRIMHVITRKEVDGVFDREAEHPICDIPERYFNTRDFVLIGQYTSPHMIRRQGERYTAEWFVVTVKQWDLMVKQVADARSLRTSMGSSKRRMPEIQQGRRGASRG